MTTRCGEAGHAHVKGIQTGDTAALDRAALAAVGFVVGGFVAIPKDGANRDAVRPCACCDDSTYSPDPRANMGVAPGVPLTERVVGGAARLADDVHDHDDGE